MVAWGSEVTAVRRFGSGRGRIPTKAPTARRINRNASFKADTIILLEVFGKKAGKTPKAVIETCKKRLRDYDSG